MAKANSRRTTAATKSNATAETIQRIEVSHFHKSKLYKGSKGEVIAAGLSTAAQCPETQGDPSAIQYKLGGRPAYCSLQDCGDGPEYWVGVDDPQPAVCRAVLKALGDPCALDELIGGHTGIFLALDDYAQHIGADLPINYITHSRVLELFCDKLSAMVERARRLFKANMRYQEQIAKAAEALDRIMAIAEALRSNDGDPPEFDYVPTLQLCVAQLGGRISNAGECAGERVDWGPEPERIAELVGGLVEPEAA